MPGAPQQRQIPIDPLFGEAKRGAANRRGCYLLYVATYCAIAPVLHEQQKDAAAIDGHQVTSVTHHHATVDRLKRPTGFGDRPRTPLAGAP